MERSKHHVVGLPDRWVERAHCFIQPTPYTVAHHGGFVYFFAHNDGESEILPARIGRIFKRCHRTTHSIAMSIDIVETGVSMKPILNRYHL
jgi:hypothetical protein